MSNIGDRIARLSPERQALLLKRLGSAQGGVPESIQRIPRTEGPRLASFGQERLWFIDQLDPGRSTYNLHIALRVTGSLAVEALEESVRELVRRHEALRTTFSVVDGRLVQVIGGAEGYGLEFEDLSGLSAEVRDAEVERRASEEARRLFDLARGPLFRAKLFELNDAEHALVLTMHHSVADGWSQSVLLRELGTLYEAFRRGGPSPLPPLRLQYSDFAIWQRQWLSGERLEAELGYWREQLAGASLILDVPADRPRPAVSTARGARRPFELGADLTQALRTLSEAEGATLFMTLLAAFQVLLHRYTGETDISVGAPIAGRTRTELEELIGFFVNTLVLRTDLSGDPPFRELLGRVRRTCLGAYAHGEVPFERLVEDLRPPRDLSRHPVVQVLFALQNVPTVGFDLPDLTVTPIRDLEEVSRLDLSVLMVETHAGLSGTVEYSTDLFDEPTIARYVANFETLLQGIVADPDARLSRLPLLTAAAREQLVVDWNRTATAYARDRCVHELITTQVATIPDAVAVVCGDATLSYGELERRANQLAHHLRKRGVGPGVLVGLCTERSIEMMVGLLGILKAGGAYVPLDPAYPIERLRFVLEDTRAKLLVTQGSVRARLPLDSAETVWLDEDWSAIAEQPSEVPATGVRPEHLAYVIYTSGSTGRPKGVAIPHGGVVNFLTAMQRELRPTPDDVLLAVTTLSFDIAVLELLLPLTVGARVVLASREVTVDGHALASLMEESKATVVQGTPALWRILVESGWRGTPTLKALCGGEALPRDLAVALLERANEVWNLYGPTETTIWSTAGRVTMGEGTVPIGRPLANTQTYVLDPHGQPVPIGVPGELWIGGDGVARGYLNRPDLTAERFIPDPFRDAPGARLYRTGDLARYRADGALECLGRADQQVKVRGFRIEPGEVEAELGRHPAVRQALVVAREDRSGDRRLVAYLVPRDGVVPTAHELRATLRTTLPEYMVPAAYVVLPELPLTKSGKVDRRALPAPGGEEREPARGFLAPRSETERAIAEIWQALLRIDSVGVYDNFFDLGGHSLLAIRAMHEMKKRLQRRLGVRELWFQNLAQVAARVDDTPVGAENLSAGLPAPAIADRESGGGPEEASVVTAFYFGASPRQLFAVRHEARIRGARSRGVICCYPLGQEYIRSHRAFEQLCNRLTQRGFGALRFDYSGTGDSWGQGDEGSVPRWVDDIGAALAFERSAGMSALSLVGLRLGASLAALAGARRDDVESLVLWHPVTDGCAYLEEARAAHRALVEDRGLEETPGVESGRDELLGFPLPPAMRRTIEAVQLLELRRRPARRILLVELEGKSGPHHGLAEHLTELGAEVDHAILPDPQIWRDLENMYQPLVPRQTLEHIAAWLEGNRP